MKRYFNKAKRLFKFSRSDRNGILFLVSLILLFLFIYILLKQQDPISINDFSKLEAMFEMWQDSVLNDSSEIIEESLFVFDPNTITSEQLKRLELPYFVKENLLRYRKAGGEFKSPSDIKKLYGMNDSVYSQIAAFIKIKELSVQPKSQIKNTIRPTPTGFFDPNEASQEQLSYFGLNDFQAKNVVAYRKAGGKFERPEDMEMIYGIDSTTFKQISKHIKIETIPKTDSIVPAKKIVVELNNADTAALITLKGIGPVYARRILKYRELLGGYYHPNQLLEVYGFAEEAYESVKPHIKTDTTLISKIRINFSDYAELLRHPYLNQSQVKAILHTRNTKGAFENIEELRGVEDVDNETYIKIRPYITCR
jgi:DNA uptake protein ComE-like DNA-binding protein